jgi:diguanylate cyclase (GGDEF)-like protein
VTESRALSEDAEGSTSRRFRARLSAAFAAIIAADLDERRQAFLTTRILLWFFATLTAFYFMFYVFDPVGDTFPLVVNSVALVVYLGALLLLREGWQLAATAVGLGAATVHILVVSEFFGWQTGFHLYYGAAGQLVFMVFTDRRAWWRGCYLVVAPSAFVYCQVFLGPDQARFHVSSNLRNTLFSFNAITAGLLVYSLAVVAHQRAHIAQGIAKDATETARYLANTDALTGLVNRRPVMLELDRLAQPDGGRYCLAIADLDGFKDFNDTFGHSCGDAVLAAIGTVFRANVRTTDLVGRWGGEEFIFVLPHSTLAQAEARAERVRSAVERLVIHCIDHPHSVTISVGVADGDPAIPGFRILKRADDAMYDAKRAGRNCVRTWERETSSPRKSADDVSPRSDRTHGQAR